MIVWFVGAIFASVGVFFSYLYWVTTNDAEISRRLKGRNLYARFLLEELNQNKTYEGLASVFGREFCRDYNLAILPRLAEDMRELRVSRVVYSLFWFCYGLTWIKCKVLAGKNDVRLVLGFQLLVLPDE